MLPYSSWKTISVLSSLSILSFACGGETPEPLPPEPQATVTVSEPVNGEDFSAISSAIFGAAETPVDQNGDGTPDDVITVIGIMTSDHPNLCDEVGQDFQAFSDNINAGLIAGSFSFSVLVHFGALTAPFTINETEISNQTASILVANFAADGQGNIAVRATNEGSVASVFAVDSLDATSLSGSFSGNLLVDETDPNNLVDIDVLLNAEVNAADFCQVFADSLANLF